VESQRRRIGLARISGMIKSCPHPSSVASSRAPTASPDARLVSRGDIRRSKLLRAGAALVTLLASGCSAPAARPDPVLVQKQNEPIALEMHGSAGGLTSVDTMRLVEAGVAERCSGRVAPHPHPVAGPSLSMIWHLGEGGAQAPRVTISARLFNAGHQVSFAFDSALPPGVVPDVVFKRAVSGVACTLFRKAGYRGDEVS
jgi:hypothetical protein